jgi:transcriptional regulator NrdR family protein
MKCPKCNSPTSITENRELKSGIVRRLKRCKKCKHEFTTYEFKEEYVEDLLYERGVKNHYNAHSLCWDCSRATGFCPWSRDFEPVKGWEAEETILKTFNGTEKSYEVHKCPLFERDKRSK